MCALLLLIPFMFGSWFVGYLYGMQYMARHYSLSCREAPGFGGVVVRWVARQMEQERIRDRAR